MIMMMTIIIIIITPLLKFQPKAALANGPRPADLPYHLDLQKDWSVFHREALSFPEFVKLAILKDDRSYDDFSPIASNVPELLHRQD